MIPISKLVSSSAKDASADKHASIANKNDSAGNKNEFLKTKDPKMAVQPLSQIEATPLSPLLEDGPVLAAGVTDAQAQGQAPVQSQTAAAPSFVESEIKRLMAEQEKITLQIRQLERTGFVLLGAVEALKGVHANTMALEAAAQNA
jgi:hypothetical protein